LNVKVFDAPPALAVDGATSATAPENNIPLKMSAVVVSRNLRPRERFIDSNISIL
jgi:hypothetical protein